MHATDSCCLNYTHTLAEMASRAQSQQASVCHTLTFTGSQSLECLFCNMSTRTLAFSLKPHSIYMIHQNDCIALDFISIPLPFRSVSITLPHSFCLFITVAVGLCLCISLSPSFCICLTLRSLSLPSHRLYPLIGLLFRDPLSPLRVFLRFASPFNSVCLSP